MNTYDFRGIVTDKEDYRHKLQGKRVWNGINISIENKKGSVRSGIDPDGKPWSIKMKYAYGRIPRTEGADGDQIDIYLGDDLNSELVFIVHQQDPWKKCYDEDKVFLGFRTRKQVEAAFKGQYNKPGFLGPIDIVSVEVFKDMIKDKSRKGKSIGSDKITDSSPLTEVLLTPLIKKLMIKLGFSRMRWIGRGWFVSITAVEYGKFLLKIPMLKVFDLQLKKFGYEIRINPLGFFIEPLRNTGL